LDNVLLNKVKSILRNEIGLGKESISTAEIYDKLTSAGVEVPELAITEILEKLVKEQLITIVPHADREGQEKHGAFMINWVSGKL
jgi:hypothetical protein